MAGWSLWEKGIDWLHHYRWYHMVNRLKNTSAEKSRRIKIKVRTDKSISAPFHPFRRPALMETFTKQSRASAGNQTWKILKWDTRDLNSNSERNSLALYSLHSHGQANSKSASPRSMLCPLHLRDLKLMTGLNPQLPECCDYKQGPTVCRQASSKADKHQSFHVSQHAGTVSRQHAFCITLLERLLVLVLFTNCQLKNLRFCEPETVVFLVDLFIIFFYLN